jgi:glyoxylase-like metal-dependent hydrolase (beta-lactamase superfamily II)
MILRQYLQTEPVVAASYLFGCAGKGVAALVDPLAPIDRYVDDAARLGVVIRYVVDTHIHADHISSAREISEATGAEYVLWSGIAADFSFKPVTDGEVLDLGNVKIEVLHTPGHTPEHLSLLITDRTRGEDPWTLLSGHTLMVGDMGRTELASSAEDGARSLFRSALRLKQLPDYVEVLPGAFSGSVCGRGLSGKASSTIGFERRFNRAFRIEDEEAFVRLMISDVPPRPESAHAIRAHNLGRLPVHA